MNILKNKFLTTSKYFLLFNKSQSILKFSSSYSFHSLNTINKQSFLSNPLFQSNFISLSKYFFRSKFTKRNQNLSKNLNYKMKDRQSLRKRLKVVGPSFFRHCLFKRTHFHHKRSKKSRANKNKPRLKLVSFAMNRYLKRNLPNLKRKSFKLGRRNR